MGYMKDALGVRLDTLHVSDGIFAQPRPVILDTDVVNDPDDFMGIRGLAALSRNGLVDILAASVNSTHASAPFALAALLHEEGRDDVTIGQFKGTAAAGVTVAVGAVAADSGIGTTVARESAHPQLPDGATVPNIVTVLRTALAARTTPDVTWLGLGFCNVLAALLASPADGISSLTGVQLVQAAMSRVVMAAGNYASGSAEFNASGDPAAYAYVAANCPVPIYWQGSEIGAGIVAGKKIKALHRKDPVRRALELFSLLDSGRNAHGPMTTLMGAYDPADLGLTATAGAATINQTTGVTTFTPGAGGDFVLSKGHADSYYLPTVDALQVPGLEPTPSRRAQVNRRRTVPRPNLASLDSGALVGRWRARDLTGSVGSAISSLPGATADMPAATQATSGFRPTVGVGVGDRPTIRFSSGGGQFLDVADASVRLTWPVLIVVLATPLDANANQTVAGVPHVDGAHTSPFFRYGLAIGPAGIVSGNVVGGLGNSGNARSWQTNPRVIELDSRAPSTSVDGVLDYAPAIVETGCTYPNATPLRIGANGLASVPSFAEPLRNADIYEVILLDGSKLTSAEHDIVYEYLRREYGTLQGAGRRNANVYATSISSNTTVVLDARSHDHAVITLGGNCTGLTINNLTDGQLFTIEWVQDATGGRTYTWPSTCKFAGGAAPTASTTGTHRDIVTFRWNGGTALYEVSRSIAVR